jgi:acyl-CoA synthetase (NDP forming)
MFVPQSVAVIGATDRESSVGRTLLANLINGLYQGKVFAINPKRKEVLGLHCYKDRRPLCPQWWASAWRRVCALRS